MAVRVVIAEDEAIIRLDLRETLEEEGYEVVAETGRGDHAVDLVREHKPDLAILDIKMPEMDGLEAARRIGAQWPGKADRPWIIALTANAMQGDREACIAAGMDDYISKPIKTEELAAAMERAVGRREGGSRPAAG